VPSSLSASTLRQPYDQAVFIEQLMAAGVPRSSIETMTRQEDAASLFSWLYEDIRDGEVCIIDGERHSVVVGVFVTDGRSVLVERDPGLGSDRKYAMGGQVPPTESAEECALREIREETPLAVVPDRLQLLETYETVGTSSRKLPGVRAPRTIHNFIYYVDSFEAVTPHLKVPYQGEDRADHDLLLLPIDEALSHPDVNLHYRTALEKHRHRVASGPRGRTTVTETTDRT
jgi:8-oxo-dGTP pyrophosphatase MutT (NUDIX family)